MVKVYLAGGMRKRPVRYSLEAGVSSNISNFDIESVDSELGLVNDVNWQTVIENNFQARGLTNFTFLNPLKNDIKDAFDQYATLDLYHAKASDIVFGYLEADNPAGHGLAVECGYAKGLGKTVIIVNETKLDDPMYRYKKFIEKSADIVFTNFVEGVLFLEKFQG